MTKEQFFNAIQNTQFGDDLTKELSINGAESSRGYWNLVCSIRDTKLYSKGILIHRNFRITDVKRYFGIKGKPSELAKQLETFLDCIKNGYLC